MKEEAIYKHEAIESCPHCGGEHSEPEWFPKKGYRTVCCHCGESILLCDECRHSEDDTYQGCDWGWGTEKCFRDRPKANQTAI